MKEGIRRRCGAAETINGAPNGVDDARRETEHNGVTHGAVAAFEVGELGGQNRALATADDPAHAVHRKALIPQLAAKRIRAFEPFIAATADRLWNANLRDGRIEWMSARGIGCQ